MNILKFLALCLTTFALTSCTSKEEKVVKELTSLTEEVEKIDNTDDLDALNTRFEELVKQMEDPNYKFSEEQAREIGRLTGKYTATVTKLVGKEAGRALRDAFNNGEELINGFMEGLQGK